MNDCASAGENQIRGCSLSRAIGAITPQHSQHLIIFVKKSVAIPVQEEKEAKKRLKLEELERLNEFNKKYPNLQKINVNNTTPRKKILNFLYELAYSKDFPKRKDFYKAKISLIRDELLEELNDIL